MKSSKNDIFIKLWVLAFTTAPLFLFGQFPPAAGQDGSTAIPAGSDVFVGWATRCEVQRGWKNIMQPDSGFVSYGIPGNATGIADNEVVSLGDGGTAVLSFDYPVTDGDGADFAVFENGFDSHFLELAFVEVSSDGVHFYRFPAISHTQVEEQVGTFGLLDPTKINNLAGKYEVGFGTPFDLAELSGIAGLNIHAVTHIRLVDVIGSVSDTVGSKDKDGNLINDPFPTPFPSGGFDLDAVGVIHEVFDSEVIRVVPNPVVIGDRFSVKGILNNTGVRCFNAIGQEVTLLKSGDSFLIQNAAGGVYFLQIELRGRRIVKKIVTIDGEF